MHHEGWGGLYRGGVRWVIPGWACVRWGGPCMVGGSYRVRVGWVIQGWGELGHTGVGLCEVGWVIQG